jgi:hypothetical protein
MKTRSPVTIDLVPAIDPSGNLVYTAWNQAVLLLFGHALASWLKDVPWKLVLGGSALIVLLASLGLPNPPRRSRRR